MVLSFLDFVSEDRFFYVFQIFIFILNVFNKISAKELVLLVMIGFLIHFLSKFFFYFVLNYNNTKGNKIYKIFYTKKVKSL